MYCYMLWSPEVMIKMISIVGISKIGSDDSAVSRTVEQLVSVTVRLVIERLKNPLYRTLGIDGRKCKV